MGIPSKLYVARREYNAEEVVGFIVIADKEHTKDFIKKKKSADRWAGGDKLSITISNEPKTGFQMVTNVSRYRTKNVLWRIRHPEGFEFEITSDNMCDLFATNTVINGVFQDELFFTENRQLVSTKTELFAEMIKREEKKESLKQAANSLVEGSGFIVNGRSTEKYVYCGKFHAMCVNKVKPLLQPTKSSLVHISKNIETGNYIIRNSMDNIEFTTSNFLDEVIDKDTVVKDVNLMYKDLYNQNNNVYSKDPIWDYKIPYVISEKPFKISDVVIEFTELETSTISHLGVPENKIYQVQHNNETMRVFGSAKENTSRSYYGFNYDYNLTSSIDDLLYGYKYPVLENGHLDYSEAKFDEHYAFNGYRAKTPYTDPKNKLRSHEKYNKLKLIHINTPQTINVGTFVVKK